MPDDTTVTSPVVTPAAPLTTSVADAIPPEQAAALAALRTRLGLDSPKAETPPATATAALSDSNAVTTGASTAVVSPVVPNTAPPSEESVLRALAEEQLRLARERRQLVADRKNDDTARNADKDRLRKLDAIEAAQKDNNRIALLRALHNGELPDGELGEWGKEVGAAMAGDIAITPEDLDKIVDRKLAAKEAAAKRANDEQAAARATVRDEANNNYLTALQGALTADVAKYPGISRFGVKAEKVLQLVEESFRTSGGKEVIPVLDVLKQLESDIMADIAATPYGTKPANIPAPPAIAAAVGARPTTVITDDPPLTLDAIETRARAEIIKRARELMAAGRQ